MLPGSDLLYRQGYFNPYYLQGYVIDYPNITDNKLVSIPNTPEAVIFIEGDSFIYEITLENEENFKLGAVRLFNRPINNTIITFTNINGDILCETLSRTASISLSNQLDWLIDDEGDTSNVHNCDFYQCINMVEQNGYLANCGISIESEQCITYKLNQCLSIIDTQYWPSDDPSEYLGCNRDDDPDGCTCCQLLTSNNQEIIDNKIIVNITKGEIEIGEIRFYGTSDYVLDAPEGLVNILIEKSGK